MKKTYEYRPAGTCCRLMTFVLDGHRIEDVQFMGGCHGNLQGIAALVRGMACEEVIARMKGIRCGNKDTSCPDQFCRALEEALRQQS